ncbi:unnamed protein product [Cylicocyclus nassatus]|uniref:Uncharacterized protein n=1 Tax=Cylicocyclus nassatus TaxID=53992 RepID=A0AA36GLG9_CYLNA|nr:unnamed protein product [Cylicocyclus nassatus]
MGSKTTKEHKASSPLSSWGGSLDDLICGEGKICSERWTPVNSRDASPIVHIRRESRSAPSIRRYSTKYDDYDLDIIKHQPLPMDSYSFRTAMEPLSFEPSHANDRRAYLPHLSDETHRSGGYPATPIQIFIDTRNVADIGKLLK